MNATIINNGDITILGSSNYETIDGDSSSGLTITNNSGATISSEGDDAIDIENASNVTITNAGTISAGDDWGIQADYADGLTINNSGTISAGDDYAIYLRNAENVSITNSGTITSAEDPINMQSSTGTVSITNSGIISQTGGGYNDGLTLQDNATFTNTGTLTASRYAIGGSSSGVTIVNKGTITGGTYDFYVPSMTITTLTNGQGGSNALIYRGKMPTNYKLFVASTSSYGKFAKEWGTSGTTTFSIDTASTLAANTYTDVFTNTTSSRFAGGLTGTCVCSNGVFTWTLSDSNSDNNWDLAIAADTTKPTTTFSPANSATAVAVASDITLTFNEAVRLINNSALDDSNVDALITLKENNSSGADIAFNATINGGKTVITINPDSNLSSTQVVYVAIGATVEDASNNAINAANVSFTTADIVAPTTTFSPANSATAVAVASDITLTFNEAVRLINNSALDDSNVDALITLKENNSSGADIAFNATINGGKTVITINPDSNLSSTQVVYVAIGATVEDASNNAINAANVSFTTADVVAPTTTFSPANSATAVAVASDITLTFNEAVRLINNSALDDSNVDALITLKENNSSGADIAFNATINGGKTVITINPDSNLSSTQVVYVAIGATVEDAANNAINAANVSFTTADVSAPTMTITSAEVSDGASSNDSTLAMTFTSSEATSNFVVGDISVNGGALSSFNGTSTTVYTATFTPSGDGAKTIDVAGGAFTDSSSNNNSAATQFNWSYNSSSPTMAITSAEVSDGASSNDSTLAMTFTSSEATSNFVVGDISVNGGALSSFNGTSTTVYTATFTPSGDGAKTIDVAAGAFTDSSSNNNSAANQFNWTYDSSSPTLSSSTPVDGSTGIAVDANIVLTFSEAVDVESGNIVIKKSSDDSIVETIDVTGSKVTGTGTTTITINPTSVLTGLTGYYLNIAATAFDDAFSNSYAGITDATTLNFATIRTSLPNPVDKKEVITNIIETSKDIAAEWADMSIQLSYNRMAWLRRHQGSIRTSYQGIKLRFRNEMIDILMNSSPNAQIYDEIYFANKAKDAIENANGSMLAVGDHIKSDATSWLLMKALSLESAP